MPCTNGTGSPRARVLLLLSLPFASPLTTFGQDCPWREYAWTRTVGGEWGDYVTAGVAVDTRNNIFVAGGFDGKVDFDPGPGTDRRRPKGLGDAYVTWYRPDGLYGGTYTFGATKGPDYLYNSAYAVERRSPGGFVVGGAYSGKTDFDPGAQRDARASKGGPDAFVAAFREDLSYNWAWTAGGPATETIWALTVGTDGSVYAAGYFHDRVVLGEGEDKHEIVSNGDADVFVVKLSSAGALLWSVAFGGSERDIPYGIAADSQGNVVVAGGFRGDVDFDPQGQHAFRSSNGEEDIFLLKLTVDGRLDWLRTIGNSKRDNPRTAIIGPDDVLYVGGAFSGIVDFDPEGRGDVHDSSPAYYHAFVTRYGSDGSYGWTRSFGGDTDTYTKGIAISGDRVILTGGYFGTVDLDPGEGIDERPAFGARSNYVCYWTLDGMYLLGDVFGGEGLDRTMGIAADPEGNVYVGGDFDSPVADFDPTSGVSERVSHGGTDIFLTKFNCGTCEYVERHDLEYEDDVLRSTVFTLAPLGKITAALRFDGGETKKSKKIHADGRVRIEFPGLAPGEYACSVRRVRAADGSDVCQGLIAERRIVIP